LVINDLNFESIAYYAEKRNENIRIGKYILSTYTLVKSEETSQCTKTIEIKGTHFLFSRRQVKTWKKN
jgi:hypothetical protein